MHAWILSFTPSYDELLQSSAASVQARFGGMSVDGEVLGCALPLQPLGHRVVIGLTVERLPGGPVLAGLERRAAGEGPVARRAADLLARRARVRAADTTQRRALEAHTAHDVELVAANTERWFTLPAAHHRLLAHVLAYEDVWRAGGSALPDDETLLRADGSEVQNRLGDLPRGCLLRAARRLDQALARGMPIHDASPKHAWLEEQLRQEPDGPASVRLAWENLLKQRSALSSIHGVAGNSRSLPETTWGAWPGPDVVVR